MPSTPNFMDLEKLEPFYKYCVSIPAVRNNLLSQSLSKADFNAECQIFKRILKIENMDQFMNERESIDMSKLCSFMMKQHSTTAPTLTIMYRVAATAGFASARVESLFSALTKIDAPQRRSMDTERESDLTFLFYEKDTLMALKFEDFLM